MFHDLQTTTLVAVFAAQSVYLVARTALTDKRFFQCYTGYLWVFFLLFAVAECFSFSVGIWALPFLCFWALREFFSLVDFRLQDRWGILGAYVSIPFMTYFIQIEWYGMFIISIPVYAFLVVPFLLSLGGRDPRGTVFSIGAIDFGLFLFVYCLGHVGFLAACSTWMAVLLVADVFVCDCLDHCLSRLKRGSIKAHVWSYCVTAALTIALSVLVWRWAAVPLGPPASVCHAIVLGGMIPALVLIGNHTIAYVMSDLGISQEHLLPGRGQVLASVRSFFYASPVVFHYVRYFLT